MRIGCGFDVHAFERGRPLVIGGVKIPYEKGLQGHSDADVLLHAMTDALLGAAGKGDIGQRFPDSDPEYRNADSLKLLQAVWEKLSQDGWKLGNLDATIIAEKPKMAPYIKEMKDRIASVLEARPEQIGVKATTTEKLGFCGREEGIAAQAVALLYRSESVKIKQFND